MAMALFVLVAVCFALTTGTAQAALIGGSSSAAPIEAKLIASANALRAGIPAYASTNSLDGRLGLKKGTYQIGVSTDPFTIGQAAGLGPFTIPHTLATFSFVTHKAGLALSPRQLVYIYTGRITQWQQIKGSGLTGPIVPVARADAAGATEIVWRYLYLAKGGWPYSRVGEGPFAYPRNVVLEKGSAALLKAVSNNPRAIGYGQTGIALALGLKEVLVPNHAGRYLSAASARAGSVIGAIPRALPPANKAWSGINLVYAPGVDTYPIVSFIYQLFRPNYAKYGKTGGLVIAFGLYSQSHTAQVQAAGLSFTPLPTKTITTNKVWLKRIPLAKGVKYPFPVPA